MPRSIPILDALLALSAQDATGEKELLQLIEGIQTLAPGANIQGSQ